MTSYGLAMTYSWVGTEAYPASIISFTCTVPEVAAGLLSEVRAAAPECKVTEERYLSPGVLYHWSVDNIGYKKNDQERNNQFVWWIISWLCSQGWEPYAVDGSTYYFRLKQEEGK